MNAIKIAGRMVCWFLAIFAAGPWLALWVLNYNTPGFHTVAEFMMGINVLGNYWVMFGGPVWFLCWICGLLLRRKSRTATNWQHSTIAWWTLAILTLSALSAVSYFTSGPVTLQQLQRGELGPANLISVGLLMTAYILSVSQIIWLELLRKSGPTSAPAL